MPPDLAELTFDTATADGDRGHASFFAFESDFVASLRCIPMCVRLKLDRAGIKLSLRQWSRLTRQDRQDLVDAPCAGPANIAAYTARLRALVRDRADEAARALTEPVEPLWEQVDLVPTPIVAFARQCGVSGPSLSQWAALSELQRFALIKLSRDNHDNVNFKPALSEFGLAVQSAPAIDVPESGPPQLRQ